VESRRWVGDVMKICPPSPCFNYVLRENDTCWDLAQLFDVDIDWIKNVLDGNYTCDESRAWVGDLLEICINGSGALKAERDNTTLIIAIVVPISVVIILASIAILVWLRSRSKITLNLNLPENWIWEESYLSTQNYNISKTDPVYYYKEIELTPNSKSKESGFFSFLVEKLEFRNLKISKVSLLSCRALAVNMSNYRHILMERLRTSGAIFNKKDWEKTPDFQMRTRTIQRFEETYKIYQWNNDLSVEDCPVIPVAHGTSCQKASKIAATGFASLSTLDKGYYGKGIYFTSYAIYTVPYIILYPDPCILISFLLPGNPYPVIEPPSEKDSLLGSHIISGYQSHYIVTTRDGFPFKDKDIISNRKKYDEIVIDQESQVVPIFLVEIDNSNFDKLSAEYGRVVNITEGKENTGEGKENTGDLNNHTDQDEIVDIRKLPIHENVITQENNYS